MRVMKFFVKNNVLTADDNCLLRIPESVDVRTTVANTNALLEMTVQFLLKFFWSVYISSTSEDT